MASGSGYAELFAGANQDAFFIRGEVGARPLTWLSVFGYGSATGLESWEAGIGARAQW